MNIESSLTGADPRVAATANVVSGMVVIETLNNRLKVNDEVATLHLDEAIRATQPESGDKTGDVVITDGLLNQAKTAVGAFLGTGFSPDLTAFATMLDKLTPDQRASDIEGQLPAIKDEDVEKVLARLATSTNEDLEHVNALIRAEIDRDRSDIDDDNSGVSTAGTDG